MVEKTTVAQKGHAYYQFQYFPILNFLITNFWFGYFSLPMWNFLVFDFQYIHFSLPNLAFLLSNMAYFLLPILTYPCSLTFPITFLTIILLVSNKDKGEILRTILSYCSHGGKELACSSFIPSVPLSPSPPSPGILLYYVIDKSINWSIYYRIHLRAPIS